MIRQMPEIATKSYKQPQMPETATRVYSHSKKDEPFLSGLSGTNEKRQAPKAYMSDVYYDLPRQAMTQTKGQLTMQICESSDSIVSDAPDTLTR